MAKNTLQNCKTIVNRMVNDMTSDEIKYEYICLKAAQIFNNDDIYPFDELWSKYMIKNPDCGLG